MHTATATLNLSGLDGLTKEFAELLGSALKVGVLKTSNARDDGTTNAVVGLKNEFGDPHPSSASPTEQAARGRGPAGWNATPMRSFLRMPLIDHLPAELQANTDAIKDAAEGRIAGISVAEVVGVIATNTIQTAFDTEGYGKWQPNTQMTKDWKGSDRPLIDSHQLRNSVQFEIVPA